MGYETRIDVGLAVEWLRIDIGLAVCFGFFL